MVQRSRQAFELSSWPKTWSLTVWKEGRNGARRRQQERFFIVVLLVYCLGLLI